VAKFISFHPLVLPWTIIGWLREKGATQTATQKDTAEGKEPSGSCC
jgi:hypothetical protein